VTRKRQATFDDYRVDALAEADRRYKAEASRQGALIMRITRERDALLAYILGMSTEVRLQSPREVRVERPQRQRAESEAGESRSTS
jgi:hypothetical protein